MGNKLYMVLYNVEHASFTMRMVFVCPAESEYELFNHFCEFRAVAGHPLDVTSVASWHRLDGPEKVLYIPDFYHCCYGFHLDGTEYRNGKPI